MFLYLLFPSDMVKTYIEYKAGEAVAGGDLYIEKLAPGLPAALFFSNAYIVSGDETVFRFDSGRVAPAYDFLFSREPALRFRSEAAGGQFDGTFRRQASGSGYKVVSQIRFEDVDLLQVPIMERISPAGASGTARGEFEFETTRPSSDPVNGRGVGKMQISGLRIQLDEIIKNMTGVDHLGFSTAEAEGEIAGDRITIERFRLHGSDLTATGSGMVTLRQPAAASPLDLEARVDIHPRLLRHIGAFLPEQHRRGNDIPVRITGTLGEPRVQ